MSSQWDSLMAASTVLDRHQAGVLRIIDLADFHHVPREKAHRFWVEHVDRVCNLHEFACRQPNEKTYKAFEDVYSWYIVNYDIEILNLFEHHLAHVIEQPAQFDKAVSLFGELEPVAWSCMRRCNWCSKLLVRDVLHCSVCRVARYCNEDCQHKHWIIHKMICKR